MISVDKLAEVLQDLEDRERIFCRPEPGTTRAEFQAMMADNFREVGISGRLYSRDAILDELEGRRPPGPFDESTRASHFTCQLLATDTFLLTYDFVQNGTRNTRRSSIWRRDAGSWKIIFHQGTLIQDETSSDSQTDK